MKDKTKYKKLLEAHNNNIKISDYNLKDKYTNFEISKYDESKTLLYEIEKKPKTYKRYSRGSIIKVKFGVNIGSEFSGDHYAIVISKQDTMFNPVLHVIPLTSDSSTYNLDMGEIIYNEKEIKQLEHLQQTKTNTKELKKIEKCLNYYKKNKDRKSYACIKHMKTISKLAIISPINEYDYLKNLKIKNKKLEEIDYAIIKEYTTLNINE